MSNILDLAASTRLSATCDDKFSVASADMRSEFGQALNCSSYSATVLRC